MIKLLNIAAVTLLGLATAGAALAEHHEGGHEGHAHKGEWVEKMFEKVDTNKDGLISKAESTAFETKKFTETDTNKDGSLSKEEVEAHKKAKMEKYRQMKQQNGDAPATTE